MDKEGWQEQAYAALRGFFRYEHKIGSPPVTIEFVRKFLYGYRRNVCSPVDERWWGPVVQRALREKIIRRKGFAPAKSSHGALKARYVGTRFA